MAKYNPVRDAIERRQAAGLCQYCGSPKITVRRAIVGFEPRQVCPNCIRGVRVPKGAIR